MAAADSAMLDNLMAVRGGGSGGGGDGGSRMFFPGGTLLPVAIASNSLAAAWQIRAWLHRITGRRIEKARMD